MYIVHYKKMRAVIALDGSPLDSVAVVNLL